MPRRCSVCAHPDVVEIDQALAAAEALRQLAKRYAVSPSALSRHRKDHLATVEHGSRPGPATEARSAAVPDLDVAHQLKAINAACLEVLSRARRDDRPATLLKAVDRIHRQIDLQAKLLRSLQASKGDRVAQDLSKWPRIRRVVVEALRPYPDARHAVVEALRDAEARSGV